jgi:hypothetical protein
MKDNVVYITDRGYWVFHSLYVQAKKDGFNEEDAWDKAAEIMAECYEEDGTPIQMGPYALASDDL